MKKGITILILLIIACSIQAGTLDIKKSNPKDDLLLQLSQTAPNDTTRLRIYNELTLMSQDSTKLYYIDKLIEEAELLDHDWYKCRGYLDRMVYAYNNYDVQEVNRWMEKLEPLARKCRFYDFLFQGKRCTIDMLMVNGEYEREEKEANEMLQSAEKVKNDLGILLANQCLSNVYRMTFRNKEATVVLKRAYEIAVRLDDPFICEINNSLIAVYKELGDNANFLKWIKVMDKYLQELVKKDPKEEIKSRVWLLMTHLSYVDYYTGVKDYASAEMHLKRMGKYRMRNNEINEFNYFLACLNYYKASGQLEDAVAQSDSILAIFKDVSLLSYLNISFTKADLLAQSGREDEAVSIYQQSFAISDSANVDLVNKQTEQLKQDYDTNTLILETKRSSRNLQLLLLGLAILIITILFVFVSHAHRVQRKLRQSEDEMRNMAETMELANTAKENFLATISSSINIPLNAVVSGALQLATNEVTDKQERQIISGKLNKTSVELMELINCILNLSKLEAGMMKFKEEDIEIHPFVQGILTMAKSNGRMVKSELAGDTNTAKVCFDIAHLQSIFNHLLVPAGASDELSLEMRMSDDSASLLFGVEGTLLAAYAPKEQPQTIAINNEVNRLLIEHFGGRYEVCHELHPYTVRFTLPVR